MRGSTVGPCSLPTWVGSTQPIRPKSTRSCRISTWWCTFRRHRRHGSMAGRSLSGFVPTHSASAVLWHGGATSFGGPIDDGCSATTAFAGQDRHPSDSGKTQMQSCPIATIPSLGLYTTAEQVAGDLAKLSVDHSHVTQAIDAWRRARLRAGFVDQERAAQVITEQRDSRRERPLVVRPKGLKASSG